MEKKQHKEFFITYSIEKSKETLKEVEFLLSNNLLNVAQSRLYYAIYYAISALAYKENFKTSKHSQLMGWFNKEFIHQKQIFPQFFNLYKNAFENRQKSDYEISYTPLKENIQENLIDTIDFIDAIETYIDKN